MYCWDGRGKTRKDRTKNELIRKNIGLSIGDKLKDSFEMVWTYSTQSRCQWEVFSFKLTTHQGEGAGQEDMNGSIVRIDLKKWILRTEGFGLWLIEIDKHNSYS